MKEEFTMMGGFGNGMGFARMAWNGRAVPHPGRTDRVAPRATTRQKLTAHLALLQVERTATTWIGSALHAQVLSASDGSVVGRLRYVGVSHGITANYTTLNRVSAAQRGNLTSREVSGGGLAHLGHTPSTLTAIKVTAWAHHGVTD